MKQVYIIGTADTKGEELAYIAAQISALGKVPLIVDVGTRAPTIAVDISAKTIVGHSKNNSVNPLKTDDRGQAMAGMGTAFADYITTRNDIAGVIGIGGGGGTSIITTGMRALPLGLPKLMVSTLASSDVTPYVGVSDITMMPSITDLAGLNQISRIVLNNAASAIVGMADAPPVKPSDKPAIGLTMFGVTTPAITPMVEQLKPDYDCLVFHATGTGGRAMENLVRNNMLTGILDITTTEIADHLVGGVLSAGEERLDAICNATLPYVGSVGALDIVNFWARDTVPQKFQTRHLYEHNPNVTLMRTTPEECEKIGKWIGKKLNRMKGPVRFLIPEKGVSSLDIEGGLFFDPEADAALFNAIETSVTWNDQRKLQRLPFHINDPEFAKAAIDAWREISEQQTKDE